MFGFPGEPKKNWMFSNLKDCCILNPKRDKSIDKDLEYSFVPMPSVDNQGHIDASVCKPYNELAKGFTYFAENDVLFAKITPCMENGKGCVATGLCNGIGFGSTEFHVLRPKSGITNPYWLYILTKFEKFREDAEKNMTGSGGQRRVPISYFENFKIALPPIELQNEFADFVQQADKSKFHLPTIIRNKN